MQQRQPRLGDILDDYCPRERRLTNHAVVAMIGDVVRLTRCTTCDSEHDYKQAKIPRQRKKNDSAALSTPVAVVPKRVVHEAPQAADPEALARSRAADGDTPVVARAAHVASASDAGSDAGSDAASDDGREDAESVVEEGPVHRQLIRAQLPRQEGQPAAPRQAPDFTIRQPTGRQNRFRPQPRRGAQGFQGPSGRAQDQQAGRQSNNSGHGNGVGNSRGGAQRQSGRPPMTSRPAGRPGGGGRKHSK